MFSRLNIFAPPPPRFPCLAENELDQGFLRETQDLLNTVRDIQHQKRDLENKRLDRDAAAAAMANAPVERMPQFVDQFNVAKDLFFGVPFSRTVFPHFRLSPPVSL